MEKINSLKLKELLEQTSGKDSIAKAVRYIGKEENNFMLLLKCIEKEEKRYGAKASWVMRAWLEKYPQFAIKFTDAIIKLLEKSDADPVLRNLSGVIIDHGYPVQMESTLINLCFGMLQQNTRAVAVHANALAILEKLTKKYPELKNEIRLITERHPNADFPSFRVRIRRFKFL